MGMNDDRLSEREHNEMRDVVLAGAQRMRPAGAHRAQLVAGAVALLLVGGITAGAVTTAALLGDERTAPIATPTQTAEEQTPTQAPTPTAGPTPSTPPTKPDGTEPFGGQCANTLTDGAVETVTGIDMIRSDYRWTTGADARLGGIDCLWVSDGVYLAATVHLWAYPEEVVAEGVRAATSGCAPSESDDTQVVCTAAGVRDGTWMMVRASGPSEAVTQAGADLLFAKAAEQLGAFPAPAPATPGADWWTVPDCEQLVAQIDPATYGYERVALAEPQSTTWYPPDAPQGIPLFAGATSWCDLHFTSGSEATLSGEVVTVAVVPGGAIDFPSAAAAPNARPLTVEGAEAAVVTPGLDRYEGSPSVLVVSDGVNILMVTPDLIRDPADAAPLATTILALIHP